MLICAKGKMQLMAQVSGSVLIVVKGLSTLAALLTLLSALSCMNANEQQQQSWSVWYSLSDPTCSTATAEVSGLCSLLGIIWAVLQLETGRKDEYRDKHTSSQKSADSDSGVVLIVVLGCFFNDILPHLNSSTSVSAASGKMKSHKLSRVEKLWKVGVNSFQVHV